MYPFPGRAPHHPPIAPTINYFSLEAPLNAPLLEGSHKIYRICMNQQINAIKKKYKLVSIMAINDH
jgi:hypothetical protein